MTNLPSNQNASTHLSQARAEHREWIGGRSLTLLSHYWRDDDPVELTSAIGQDWADVLEGILQEFVQRACVKYLMTEPRRKPSPGAIYQLAVEMMPKPKRVEQLEPIMPDRVAAETANEIMKAAGFNPRKFGGEP